MLNFFLTGLYKFIVVVTCLVLIGCNSSNDPDPPVTATTTDAGQVTVDAPENCSLFGRRSNSAADDVCIDVPVDQTAQLLTTEETITDTLAENESTIYQVDSGVELSLISDVGNVDILLYDNIEDIDSENIYDNDKQLCGSTKNFKEDNCTASTVDGDMFVHVYAREDSDYQINATSDCSVNNINRWVNRNMQDYYLFADQVPVLNPDSYDDPSELLDDLRFKEADPFSSLRDAGVQSSFFEEGIEFGLGWRARRDDNDDVRVTYVYDDSTMGRAGVKRGDIAVAIEGEPLVGMSDERYFELIGTQEEPVESTWQFTDGETGESYSASIAQSEYRINSVLYNSAYTRDSFDGTIGYLVLKQFIVPTANELDQVFEYFASIGVTELVLDLRYNGGGRVWVARRLAEQIAGSQLDGQLELTNRFNERYSSLDFSSEFSSSTPSLNLNRVVVLTTGATASASERIISTLRPYIEVVTVGSATDGKPFTSSGLTYCGRTLNAMHSEGFNANSVSVRGGISADCFASDDISKDFGDANESMLRSALEYIATGACLTDPLIAARSDKSSASKEHLRFNENSRFEYMSDE